MPNLENSLKEYPKGRPKRSALKSFANDSVKTIDGNSLNPDFL